MAKSRAEIMSDYRQKNGQFSVSIAREKLDKLNAKLKDQGKTKTGWLNEKIDEEIGEGK